MYTPDKDPPGSSPASSVKTITLHRHQQQQQTQKQLSSNSPTPSRSSSPAPSQRSSISLVPVNGRLKAVHGLSLSVDRPDSQESAGSNASASSSGTVTQETTHLLKAPPSFYPTSTQNARLVVPQGKSKRQHSIAEGLFQAQSNMNQFLPVAPMESASQSYTNLASIGEDSVGEVLSPVETQEDGVQHELQHSTAKYKKYSVGKFRRPSDTKSTSSSMESIVPLYTEQMLRNPILTDMSQYDGNTLIRKKTNETTRGFNNADLLTRQITQMNAASHQHFEKHADVLTENQRGWFILGYPFFSKNMLFSLDPEPWTYGPSNKAAPGDIHTFPLPDPSWDWTWNSWYVDMAYDVDDQGWSYSWRFASNAWHGSHVWFHSFVRKRRWLRLRHRLIPTQETPPETRTVVTGTSTASAATTAITRPLSPTSSIRSFKSIRSTAPSIAESVSHEYRMLMKGAAEAQQYGSKYFVIPPAGRVEARIASRRAQPASDSLKVPSFDKKEEVDPRSDSHGLHFPHKFTIDPFSTSPASGQAPHTLSELLVDLSAARIDRERLEILSNFVSDLTNYTALVAAVKTEPDHIYIRRILQTFTHLDSKIHLIEHLNGVLESLSDTLKDIKKRSHKEGISDADHQMLKQQKKMLKQYAAELQTFTQFTTRIIKQQQYYTDKDIDALNIEDAFVESATN
ncbi:uncharacterized protein SAPINGB_P004898 [Magnusiomyces paraingens]|uniref:Peroxin/Ferlin domain-containing protein n=1 Tax=Magnusiomyces paraingens TaxID=2606893 RepID=A0A5E8C4Y4_9ASCO|nr:uncharacterized protein SAPINGB_P004898 [Saprochaete ingens]VVT56216.1 unnamed protein product [Saprochaete ingens]